MKKIKVLLSDVDGTLTDGSIIYSDSGHNISAFCVKDGMAIKMLRDKQIVPAIVSNRSNPHAKTRFQELGVADIFLSCSNKRNALDALCEKYDIGYEEIAYIGDDLNDIDCINLCKLTAAPQDAIIEVKAKAKYVCHKKGGQGAYREFCELVLLINSLLEG